MMKLGKVVAVVVTYNRKELLARCLDAILRQTRLPDEIIVVNNSSSDGTLNMLEAQYAGEVAVLNMLNNVGGAGGFYRGINWACDQSADWIWMMDDDGVPDNDALEKLLGAAKNGLYDILNAAVVDIDDPKLLSFGLEAGGRVLGTVGELTSAAGPDGLIANAANPFNSTLVSRTLIDKIGCVKLEMFIWGDEIEFVDRARESGAAIATVMSARHFHPKNKKNVVRVPFSGGKLKVVIAPQHAANVHARNMAYNARKSSFLVKLLKPALYFVFFCSQGKLKRSVDFVRYWRDGVSDRYDLAPSRAELRLKAEEFEVKFAPDSCKATSQATSI
ncbi:glycosyltransferase [Rhizobium sp. Rhizsp82]|uniref:glycosyltransferase n=1 Tax=Rhizobium sp. Rhizsp82 TaxID=3243057 RepID=UPI0039B36FBD